MTGPSPGIVGASQYAAPMPIFTLPPEVQLRRLLPFSAILSDWREFRLEGWEVRESHKKRFTSFLEFLMALEP